MALNACAVELEPATRRTMQGEPWQIRAKQAGLRQRDIARIADKPENTISRQLRGEFGEVPGYLIAIIIAYETMSEHQRTAWIAAVEAELKRREKP